MDKLHSSLWPFPVKNDQKKCLQIFWDWQKYISIIYLFVLSCYEIKYDLFSGSETIIWLHFQSLE